MNYLEPEYEAELADNSWTKILDESKEDGNERFAGLIEKECWPDLY